MTEENISQEFRWKNIDETKNYSIEKINQNELMSRKHKNVSEILNTFLFWFLQLLDVFPFRLLLL